MGPFSVFLFSFFCFFLLFCFSGLPSSFSKLREGNCRPKAGGKKGIKGAGRAESAKKPATNGARQKKAKCRRT
jgi:hypothetical protein